MTSLRAVESVDDRATSLLLDHHSEVAILADLIVDGALVLASLPQSLKADDFSEERHRRIFEAAVTLHADGKTIGLVSIMTRLKDEKRLQQVGPTYVTELACLSAKNPPRYLRQLGEVVIDRAARRRARLAAGLLQVAVERDGTPLEKILENARAQLAKIEVEVCSTGDDKHASAVVDEAMASIHAASEGKGTGAGIPTGFAGLDRVTGGIHEGELVVAAGRPGMGKTSIAMQIALHLASSGLGVFYVALENRFDLMKRAVALKASVNLRRLQDGRLSRDEWSRVTTAAEELRRLPLWVDDTSGPTARQVGTTARRIQLQLAHEGRRLGLIVVDFVQLLRAPRLGMERHQVVAENVRTLRSLAGDLRVGVLCLSQLNRGVDKRNDRRPVVSDLAESGELEQAAHAVWFLFRPDHYRRGGEPDGEAEIIIGKQNGGQTGVAVPMRFDAPRFRFSDALEDAPSMTVPSNVRPGPHVVPSPAAATAPRDDDEPHAFAGLIEPEGRP